MKATDGIFLRVYPSTKQSLQHHFEESTAPIFRDILLGQQNEAELLV
jgi:hypothetical protein